MRYPLKIKSLTYWQRTEVSDVRGEGMRDEPKERLRRRLVLQILKKNCLKIDVDLYLKKN